MPKILPLGPLPEEIEAEQRTSAETLAVDAR